MKNDIDKLIKIARAVDLGFDFSTRADYFTWRDLCIARTGCFEIGQTAFIETDGEFRFINRGTKITFRNC